MKAEQQGQNRKSRRKERRRSIFGAVVDIWAYRAVTLALLLIPVVFFTNMLRLIVDSSGTAITTANLRDLMNWRAPLILLLGLLLVMSYIVFEIFGQIYLSCDILTGEDIHVFREMKKGIRSVRRFLSPRGLLAAIYISLAVPLCGIGFTISMTESFYIPDFITGVIYSKPLLAILYGTGIAALIYLSFRWVFMLHAMLLDDMSAGEAQKRSFSLMKEHWKDFLKRFAVIIGYSALILSAAYLLIKILPQLFVEYKGKDLPSGCVIDLFENSIHELTELEESVLGYRIAGALSIVLGGYLNAGVTFLVSSNIIMRLTKLYFTYTGRQVQQAPPGSKRRFRFRTAAFIGLPVLIAAGAVVLGMFFDQIPIFQRDRMPKIVAHRTGGIMASENSLEGVDESVKKGIYGVETDIQRTKDGAYIINHDNTFRRLTGVNKTPGALTLAEVKELRIRDTTGSGALLEVPTMEELLDRCKGRITPFVELKGASADRRMADDAVAAIRERNMTDETVLISLNYKVLDYIKKTYPEFETGVLIFAGLGDVSKLNCDMIIMEEEMSTYAQIQAIHAAGKKAGVWTVNKEEELRRFLDSEADCIITDEIPMAVRIQEELQSRSDVQLMHDRLTLMP